MARRVTVLLAMIGVIAVLLIATCGRCHLRSVMVESGLDKTNVSSLSHNSDISIDNGSASRLAPVPRLMDGRSMFELVIGRWRLDNAKSRPSLNPLIEVIWDLSADGRLAISIPHNKMNPLQRGRYRITDDLLRIDIEEGVDGFAVGISRILRISDVVLVIEIDNGEAYVFRKIIDE